MDVRARKCDRCNQYYEIEGMPEIKIQKKISETSGGTYNYVGIDLCPSCAKEVRTMLEVQA